MRTSTTPTSWGVILRCAGSSAARQSYVMWPRPARWGGSRPSGSRVTRTLPRSPSPAPAIIRCSFSTSSATSNGARCVRATFTRRTAGGTCLNRSRPATGSVTCVATSAPMPPLPTPRSTSSWRPKVTSTRSGCRRTASSKSASCRPPAAHGPALLRQLQLSGGKLDDATARRGQGRVAPR
jgi:hypothetical protein